MEKIGSYFLNEWLNLNDKDERDKSLDSIICVITIVFNSDIIGEDYNTEDDYESEIEIQKLIRTLKELNDNVKKSKFKPGINKRTIQKPYTWKVGYKKSRRP